MNRTPDWIADLPAGWDLRVARRLFRERRQLSLADDVHLTPSQHHGVLPQSEYMQKTGSRVVLNLTGADNMKHVEPDDFVIHLRSFQGGIEHSPHRGKVSNAYTVFAPSCEIDPRYYKWVLKSHPVIEQLASTTDQLRDGQSIKFEQFASLMLPVPPLEEQRRIANYLDDQTTRIDQAIQLRQQQITLLEQWEESQVEELLSAAETVPLRRLGTKVTTGPFGTVFAAADYTHDGIPMINPTHIVDGRIEPDRAHAVSPETAERLARHRLQAGDVIAGRKGDIGRSALVTADEDGWICGSDAVAVHPAESNLVSEFLAVNLHSRKLRADLVARSPGATMPSLNEDMLLSIEVPALNVLQQVEAVKRFRCIHGHAKRSRDALRASSQLLAERRRSLVTAALTGELDVSSTSSGTSEAALSVVATGV